MSGATPPLPNTPSWRGAQLKHRDTFSFTGTILREVYKGRSHSLCKPITLPSNVYKLAGAPYVWEVHNGQRTSTCTKVKRLSQLLCMRRFAG
jgi:hypothetical protein